MSGTTLVFLLAGLALLIVGAELLVRGASRLAAVAGISPLVIGLTVVAYGTSAPELAVSVQSALAGQADIALGNVVGSNIFNVLFILGLSAMIAPLIVSQQLVRLDVPIMIGVSLLLFILALDGSISRLDGVLLTAGVVAYTIFAIRLSRKESAQIKAEYAAEYGASPLTTSTRGQVATRIVFILAGLGLLVLGARLLVDSATLMAQAMGVSDLVIGLTIVAAGTSLPEVATSIVAAMRGERDIAVGNVVGSNIYNILAILGVSSLVATDGVTVAPAAESFDIPVMIAVAVACLPIFFTGHLIARWEGALFFCYYVVYTLYLILNVAQHDSLPMFSAVMWLFVIPLTVITMLVSVVRAVRARRQAVGG